MSNSSQYFVTGTPLSANAPSYVARSADGELIDGVAAGELCHVLAPRQMGKSSLMNRAIAELRGRSFLTASVDLAKLRETPSASEWYIELIGEISRALQIPADAAAFWASTDHMSLSQRLVSFLHDEVLQRTEQRIAIFVDSVDATLRLEFRDSFFAAIRALHTQRASHPAYSRLSFVLLGVASPADLIDEPLRTPFSIGRSIELAEFTEQEAAPLLRGLERRYVGQGHRILRRIMDWTAGHPYLTQRLCKAAVDIGLHSLSDEGVDRLVTNTFFSAVGQDDRNIASMHRALAATPPRDRQELLATYRGIAAGREVVRNDASAAHRHLELYGFVRADRRRLVVRNRVYAQVFNLAWAERQLAAAAGQPAPAATPPRQRRTGLIIGAAGALLLATVAVALIGAFGGGAGRPVSATTAAPTSAAPASPTDVPATVTDVPATAIPTDTATAIPTDTATAIPSATPTEAPAATGAPAAAATETAAPSTPTAAEAAQPPGDALCRVIGATGVTARERPQTGARPVGSLRSGATFTPTARTSADSTFVWVQVSAEGGWVYAGTAGEQLVSCAGLESVPVSAP